MRINFLLMICLTCWVHSASAAQPLLADLSNHLISITTDFTGSEVVLFGAIDKPGDLIVVVEGPGQNLTVRRKDKVAGIWVNRQQILFSNVPSFYHILSNRDVSKFASADLLETHEIGLDHLYFETKSSKPIPIFTNALIRRKIDNGLYGQKDDAISIMSDRLFRANIDFPDNVPIGRYSVSVYLFEEGKIIDSVTTPLIISKTGMSARLYVYSRDMSLVYGICSVLAAVLCGFGAGYVFRRG